MNFMKKLELRKKREQLEMNYRRKLTVKKMYDALRDKLISFFTDLDGISDSVELPSFIRAEQVLHDNIKTVKDIERFYKKLNKEAI